jgi:hypothetical protein
MASSGVLRRVALVRTLAVTSNRLSVRRLLVTASVVRISPILVTLMKEALSSSETSILTEPHGVSPQKTPLLILRIFLKLPDS